MAVLEDAGEILHVLASPLAEDRVRGRVDAARRRDHREQHHGQHLLSRAFVEVASAETVSFHLGAEVSSIDLDRDVGDEQVRSAETRANEVVWEARPVTVRTVSRPDAEALGIRPPADAGEGIRLVEARGFDIQPCGGTHPRNTSEVGVVLVLGKERYKGGSRVRFVCGHRALGAFRGRAAVVDRLGALFSASLEDLPAAAQRALEHLSEATRRCRDLQDKALEAEAGRLLSAAARPVVAAYEGWPPEDLRVLATKLVALGRGVALLGSRAGGKAHVVFAQSEGLGHDIPRLVREAAEHIGGRGGGKGNLAQGGGERAERLDEALARARARVLEGDPGTR